VLKKKFENKSCSGTNEVSKFKETHVGWKNTWSASFVYAIHWSNFLQK
jgi:hypothetical protein